jgi:hypothetical protein
VERNPAAEAMLTMLPGPPIRSAAACMPQMMPLKPMLSIRSTVSGAISAKGW